jgi:hypothetical protein
LATSSRTRREWLTLIVRGAAARFRYRVKAYHSSREWTPGSLFEHDALNSPSLDAGTRSQQKKNAMHVVRLLIA